MPPSARRTNSGRAHGLAPQQLGALGRLKRLRAVDGFYLAGPCAPPPPAYVERFGLAESDLGHVARSLTHFAEAEKNPAYPAGLTPARWSRIRHFFTRESPSLLEP